MQVFDKYGIPTLRIGLSIVYLSCIYRICNVVNSGLVAKFRGRHKVPTGRPTGYRLEVKGKGGLFARPLAKAKQVAEYKCPNMIGDNRQRACGILDYV